MRQWAKRRRQLLSSHRAYHKPLYHCSTLAWHFCDHTRPPAAAQIWVEVDHFLPSEPISKVYLLYLRYEGRITAPD